MSFRDRLRFLRKISDSQVHYVEHLGLRDSVDRHEQRHDAAAYDLLEMEGRIQALEEHAGLRADSLTAKASREMGSE